MASGQVQASVISNNTSCFLAFLSGEDAEY